MADRDVWIFLSYAPDDDLTTSASEDEVGFVTFLHRMLQLKLRDLGATQAKIWLDRRRLNLGDPLDDVVNEAIDKADLLLVVMSNNWMQRPYCRKELDLFIDVRKQAGVLNVQERMIIVGKGHVDRLKRPVELQGQEGFLFYARDDQSDVADVRPFFRAGKVRDDRFYELRDDLAAFLHRRLQRIAEDAGRRIVYLAVPATDMWDAYTRLLSELRGRGYHVVPDYGLPYGSAALAGIEGALAVAELSIHLLGESPGFAPEGLDPIVKLQLARARARAERPEDQTKRAFRRIVWAPRILDTSDPAVERDPLQVLARFDRQIATDQIHGGIWSEFVEFLSQNLVDTAVKSPAQSPAFSHPDEIERSSPGSRYYVSYAWADLTDPTRERDVDRLCDEARQRGIEVIRDKTTLSHGDLISDFMRQIGEGDRVFIFLSDKYLKSPYCMMELFDMWRNAKQNSSEFLRRVRFITIDGTKIGRPDEWLEYAKFWKRERELLKQKIDDVGWEDAGEQAQRRYDNMKMFAGKVSDVLALFADTVQPRTFEDFVKYGFEDTSEGAGKP